VLRIGLTGGIASGKSTVAQMFATLGAGVVDTDRVARDLVAPGLPALAEIAAEFGTEVLTESGALDRAALRQIVFHDLPRLRALERILHPRIREETLTRVAALVAPYAIIVVPLMFETDFHTLVERVLVVDCPQDLQLKRLELRDGVDSTTARAMLAAQIDRAERLERADDLIDNGGDLAATREQVEQLHAKYAAWAVQRLPN